MSGKPTYLRGTITFFAGWFFLDIILSIRFDASIMAITSLAILMLLALLTMTGILKP
jgi:hypothetical protein